MKKYKVSKIKYKNLTLLESAAIHTPESFIITTKKKYSKRGLIKKVAKVIKERYNEDLKSCVLEELEVDGPVIDKERAQRLTDKMEDYATSRQHSGVKSYVGNKKVKEAILGLSSVLRSLGIYEDVLEEYKELKNAIREELSNKFKESAQGAILQNIEDKVSKRLNAGL